MYANTNAHAPFPTKETRAGKKSKETARVFEGIKK